jgi:hypothetical protein
MGKTCWTRFSSEQGQIASEWLMIAGILTAFAVFFVQIASDTLHEFVTSFAASIRTIAP